MDYLTVNQAASALGLSKNTIRTWIKKGRLPGTVPVRSANSPWAYRIPAKVILPLVSHE